MSYLTHDKDAAAWLRRFMEAQARLAAEALFVTFGLGNLGAAARFEPLAAREMIEALRSDADDIELAGKVLADVLRSILLNVEQNLPAVKLDG